MYTTIDNVGTHRLISGTSAAGDDAAAASVGVGGGARLQAVVGLTGDSPGARDGVPLQSLVGDELDVLGHGGGSEAGEEEEAEIETHFERCGLLS